MARPNVSDAMTKHQNIARLKMAQIEASPVGTDGDDGIKSDFDTQAVVGIAIKYGKGTNVTDEQYANRIMNIGEMMLRGYSQREIRQWCTHTLNLGKDVITDYIDCAKKDISEPWRDNYESEHDWHVAIRKRLLRDELKDGGDKKLALSVLDSLAKIQAIYDNKPAINPQNTAFDEAEKALGEYEDIIESAADGDDTKLNEYKKTYAENDKRAYEYTEEDAV